MKGPFHLISNVLLWYNVHLLHVEFPLSHKDSAR